MWNLPLRAKIVLATTSLYGDRRKGATLADELLGRIRALAGGAMDLHVLFVGRRHKPFEERLVRLLPFTPTGYVEEPRLLATIYSAADVVLHPALEENLANSVMEGMACGTPAACFDAGGMRDVVVDGQTGALAPRGDVEALAQRVVGILAADPNQAAQRRAACSERIRRGFSADKESRLLMQAYEEALHARASA
jgi:glycosyltransferase involved in cell wall biosynthesis